MEKINCKNVNFSYPQSNKKALESLNFSINEGEFCLICGKSAAGKTTLLKLLKKEVAPHGTLSGEIKVNGTCGYLSQNVEENAVCAKVRSELSFGPANMGMSEREIELAVAETASYFNFENKLDFNISDLSGGEKQTVNLASVMIMKPDILILDEPTSQLDPVSAARFVQMIKKLHRELSVTVVISEHGSDELFFYADKIAYIDDGKIEMCSSPDKAVAFFKSERPEMLGFVPFEARIFNTAKTVRDCREIIKSKALNSPALPQKEKCETAVKVSSVCFAYKKGEDVLNRLSLNVYSGKINAVIGPNSSGKTTLLKTIAGVCKPYRGKIKANGRISMLCQNVYDLFACDTCREETQFNETTAFLEIDDIKDRHPYDLSGGQAQRLALAKVLETGADIILLDEPTKGLDFILKEKLAKILKALCSEGKTVLIVSHDIEFIGKYADIVSFLSRGSITAENTRREFFSSLSFYTTCAAKITKGIAPYIVSDDDLKSAGAFL